MTTPRPHRILCVCLGNICRSPTAEAALRAELGDRAIVDSAGTGDWHVGQPPYGPMQAAARAAGLDLSGLRARQVTRADFARFDLILAMDSDNLRDLAALDPGTGARLARYLEPLGGGDVPDPYFTRDFDGALDLIRRAARAWASRL
ncbi:low molecular weight protein-tyrosine-phosphatase [Roseicyclus persicicus]|uniref:protein-tyrosine-phosphatase n=1 Tax=Roseicyclus persicicus TaxID=2650661 RepID=A0A7X6GVZ6_9RHOB|nr:low molecular weight protein-tyrosine-phosphatase [Roseibacterium persicicum]NKX43412.1 low molecular weight phosphotyrosine protein phosphatase [Roseibacterium persicicum]